MSEDKLHQIAYEEMGEALVEVLPELREEYESERTWWRDAIPPPHVVYGDLLNPYIARLLTSKGQEEDLRRVFAFLESLANHPDPHVRDVVAVTVCEYLGGNIDLLAQARKYMGPRTQRLSEEIQFFWGRGDPGDSRARMLLKKLRRLRLWLYARSRPGKA